MFRPSRLLLQAVVRSSKSSTGIVGLEIHPDPLPALSKAYRANLDLLKSIPESAVYRQSTEAVISRKLKTIDSAIQEGGSSLEEIESEFGEGQIEEILKAAEDELSLTAKMLQWKPWEPLEEKPVPGQWTYFGKETRS